MTYQLRRIVGLHPTPSVDAEGNYQITRASSRWARAG